MFNRFVIATTASLVGFTVFAAPARQVGPQQLWSPNAQEAAAIDTISSQIAKAITDAHAKTGKAVRDAHAKQHGCVKAEVTVLSSLEKNHLNEGVFATPGKSYKAWIRFSNGSGDPAGDDRIATGRGMAIKLFGVEGTKFLDDERFTQDFQMINHPVFFVKNAVDYVEFQSNPRGFFGTPQAPNLAHLEEFKVVGALSDKRTNPPMNPLESTYFSMTPRQYGPVQTPRATKFSTTPTACAEGQALPAKVALKDSPDALRLALRETLAQGDACFYFRIQSQTNETDMPVNNPVKLWSEAAAPFVNVAKIVIHKQAFEGAAQETFCEDLSISPWHSIAEHQPLGSIELTRKVVYETTSELRHRLNGRPRQEPTGDETFQK